MKIRNQIKRKQFIKNIEVALYDAKESLNTEIKKNSKGEYDYWYHLGAYSFAQSLDKAIKTNGMIYFPANILISMEKLDEKNIGELKCVEE